MKNETSENLIHKVKVVRNLIVIQVQVLPTIENRFSQKKIIDSLMELGKRVTEIEKELETRGIYTHE